MKTELFQKAALCVSRSIAAFRGRRSSFGRHTRANEAVLPTLANQRLSITHTRSHMGGPTATCIHHLRIRCRRLSMMRRLPSVARCCGCSCMSCCLQIHATTTRTQCAVCCHRNIASYKIIYRMESFMSGVVNKNTMRYAFTPRIHY